MSNSLTVLDEESNTTLELNLSQEEYRRAMIDTEYLRELVEEEKRKNDNLSVAVTDTLQPDTSSHHDSPLHSNTEISVVEGESSASLYIWTTSAILLLLSLYEENKDSFSDGSKRHKKIWDDISKKMKEINDTYVVTGGQCQTKMNGLKRTYKKIKDHNQKSGNDRASWPFFQRMDEIFGRSGWAEPIAVASEAGPSSNDNDVPEKKKKKPNPIEKYLNEVKEERKLKAIAKERARKERTKLKQEQFQKLLDLK